MRSVALTGQVTITKEAEYFEGATIVYMFQKTFRKLTFLFHVTYTKLSWPVYK